MQGQVGLYVVVQEDSIVGYASLLPVISEIGLRNPSTQQDIFCARIYMLYGVIIHTGLGVASQSHCGCIIRREGLPCSIVSFDHVYLSIGFGFYCL